MPDLETYTPDNLIAGDFPLVTGDGTILTGQNLKRGTVLAKDSANSNKLVPVDSASATASIQSPVAVLADDVDASEADAVGPLYLSGEFSESALIFGGTDTVDTHRDALRDLSIFVKKTVAA